LLDAVDARELACQDTSPHLSQITLEYLTLVFGALVAEKDRAGRLLWSTANPIYPVPPRGNPWRMQIFKFEHLYRPLSVQ
jgi:hypothetical protein